MFDSNLSETCGRSDLQPTDRCSSSVVDGGGASGLLAKEFRDFALQLSLRGMQACVFELNRGRRIAVHPGMYCIHDRMRLFGFACP